MEPRFFAKPSEFRKWLEKNHLKASELLVGFYKVGSKKPSITWPQSVDEALCFGWIDGVRKNIDEHSYSIRFTPRKPTSIWSAININKIEMLIQKGLMFPAGIAAFALRAENKSKIYSYENEAMEFSKEFEKQFKSNKKAWEFFNKQTPAIKKLSIHRIMTAKQEITKLKRLTQFIAHCEAGKKIV